MLSSLSRFVTQLSFATAVPMTRYSTLVVDHTIVFYFLELQIIRLAQGRQYTPDMDILSLKFLTQSISAKA